jgi:hypothetical protein
MKKVSWILAIALPVAFVACQKDAVQKDSSDLTVSTSGIKSSPLTDVVAGNGAPSGAHYNLNIIGVPKDKTADMTGNNGGRIFVKLDGNSKIYLSNADLTDGQFRVLDANGTDADGASFQLPSPDPENTGTTRYSIYARPLGKPNGQATITTCATDPTLVDDPNTPDIDVTQVCSLESEVFVREKGGSKFVNVSRDLLYIYADLANDNVDGVVRIPLFDERLKDYYWSYDNNGLKVLQLRFYMEPTTITDPDYVVQ